MALICSYCMRWYLKRSCSAQLLKSFIDFCTKIYNSKNYGTKLCPAYDTVVDLLGQNESLIRVICAHGRGLRDGGTFQCERLALWGCVAPRTWNSNKSDKCIIGCFFLVRGGVDRTHMNCLSKCSLYVFVCLFLLLRKLITRSTRASLPSHVCRLSLSWGFF